MIVERAAYDMRISPPLRKVIRFLRVNRNFLVGGGFSHDAEPRAAGRPAIFAMGLRQNLVWYYRPGRGRENKKVTAPQVVALFQSEWKHGAPAT
jgi:hypothetical protein